MENLGEGSDVLAEPIPVVDLELTTAEPVAVNSAGQVWALVRRHGRPVGKLAVWGRDDDSGTDLRTRAEVEVEFDADPTPGPVLEPDPSGAPMATVVICTLGTEPRLRQTVASVLGQSEPGFEVIVVDNDPASGGVGRLLAEVDDPRLRIVDEPVRGLSAARNAGLAAASATVVAFTDDDAVADPDWLRHLHAPFSQHPDVVCVTGLVVPAELETQAQVWFEEFGGFDKGFTPTVWSVDAPPAALAGAGERGDGGVLFPYSAGVFGSGNNMAFRSAWLRAAGGFDEALGAGSATRGGEDLDAFLAVMFAGKVLFYEPQAVVRHFARRDLDGLRTQMYGYGTGMSAVVMKYFFSTPRRAGEILSRLPGGLRRLLDPGSGKNEARTSSFPAELVWRERRGYLAGPALYVRGRREAARRRTAPRR